MMALASRGPVVVFNIARQRWDAFLVTTEEISFVVIPDLTYFDVKRKGKSFVEIQRDLRVGNYNQANRELESILDWLWIVAVEPVLDKLGYRATPKQGAT
jgi:hypothetical protein